MIFYLLFLAIFQNVLCEEYPLLGQLEGEVGKENFTYYYVHHVGNILLVLRSVQGDADLYVSEKNMIPTFEPDFYDFHSATCGDDFLEIPYNVKRPLAVGVYGYSAYELSKYFLEIYQIVGGRSDVMDINVPMYNDGPKSARPPENKPTRKVKKKHENIVTKAGIWAFLDIIEMIFL